MRGWDIFCAVVDNYGDAGVCLRLARQLARLQDKPVRLWIDDPASLRKLLGAQGETALGFELRAWTPEAFAAPFPAEDVADAVIEAFACELPANYLEAMAARAAVGEPPVWINLEYLSAEAWVDGCHRMRSPHPRLPLVRHFFFPGFTPATGGLLREPGLEAAREAFVREGAPWWRAYGMAARPAPEALRVSLFSYANSALPALASAWARGVRDTGRPIACLTPEGPALDALRTVADVEIAGAEASADSAGAVSTGSVVATPLPFVSQDGYDRLLWACDLNFVRGEDSFVRAQLAGKPLVWHIYPQTGSAHFEKLDAFLERYAPPEPLRRLNLAWNGAGAPLDAAGWQALWADCEAAWPALQAYAERWREAVHGLPELAAGLITFAREASNTANPQN
ncbi:MAG: elongation factor P maturation arginine rhamnosyltransferase EarP [Candidatus Protistobacter heckmanni]|nr:elongation factor P maturation arginine rhamnosyltransferase EarP [Candidatus Protistobacter heckmanni]